MGKFPTYKLNEKQIRGLARIIDCEQGTNAGEYAEASLMANLIDCKGDEYATVDNLISFVTKKTGNWFCKGRTRYFQGYNGTVSVPQHAVDAVKAVLVNGFRILPRGCVEHDCMSDIKSVSNGTKSNKKGWAKCKTVITNVYGSKWIFWSFPGGYSDDPFGYKKEYRDKWGDFCYTYEEAMASLNKKNITTTAIEKTETKTSDKLKVINKEGANVRIGAGTNYRKCSSTIFKDGLKYSEEVKYVGKEKDNIGKVWYLIEKSGKRGYVSSKLVKVI